MFVRPPSARHSSHSTIKNAWRWLCGVGKIKCCYELRGRKKHDLFQEEEPLLLKEGSSTSASV